MVIPPLKNAQHLLVTAGDHWADRACSTDIRKKKIFIVPRAGDHEYCLPGKETD